MNKEIERKNWLVIVNNERKICGGDTMVCDTKSQAINIASFLSRILYNIGTVEKHIFVVHRVKKDTVLTVVDKDDLEYNVLYHYSVLYYSDVRLKMLLLYEGWAANQKKIASQWLNEGDE